MDRDDNMKQENQIFFAVVTCKSYVDRHILQLNHWSKYLKESLDLPFFIYENDVDDLPFRYEPFCQPKMWSKHIKYGSQIFLKNISDCSALNIKEIKKVDLEDLFPERDLRQAEISLLHKHYKFLNLAANMKYPSLVVEDDAWLEEPNDLRYLIAKCSSLTPEVGFLNLSLLDSARQRLIPSDEIQPARIETTCAYCIHPKLAQFLIDKFFPYSLPIDFHLQHLFCKYNIKGLMTKKGCFLNLSNKNIIKSTIQ